MSGIIDMVSKIGYMVDMSFEEKNTWVFLVTSLCGAAVYAALVVWRAQGVALAEVAYVGPMLSTIGAAVAVGVAGTALIALGNPGEAGLRDVRDREIARHGTNVGQSFLVLGGLLGLGLAMGEVQHFWISQALYGGFVLSAVLGSATRLVLYRKGLPG
jgi:hypothetical protein